jgi:hypothetical protein
VHRYLGWPHVIIQRGTISIGCRLVLFNRIDNTIRVAVNETRNLQKEGFCEEPVIYDKNETIDFDCATFSTYVGDVRHRIYDCDIQEQLQFLRPCVQHLQIHVNRGELFYNLIYPDNEQPEWPIKCDSTNIQIKTSILRTLEQPFVIPISIDGGNPAVCLCRRATTTANGRIEISETHDKTGIFTIPSGAIQCLKHCHHIK